MASFPRVKEGDPILAGDFNAIAEALERFANLSVSGGHLQLWEFPDGKHLALHVPVETLALLSGATSPYSFQEVDEDASGGFSVRGVGDSGTANVYEVNARSGLGGKVVPITWTEAGDWRFQYVGVTPTVCNWTFTLHGCSASSLQGYLIEIKPAGGGTTITSCTTNSLGVCTISVAVGTYDVVVTPAGGAPYSGSTTTIAHTCSQSTTITLSPTNDYICGGSCCAIEPKVIALTWAFAGGYTGRAYQDDSLTWNGSFAQWDGASTYTAASIGLPLGTPDWRYKLVCSGGVVYGLAIANASTGANIETIGFTNGPQTGSTCSPFHIINGHVNRGADAGAVWSING